MPQFEQYPDETDADFKKRMGWKMKRTMKPLLKMKRTMTDMPKKKRKEFKNSKSYNTALKKIRKKHGPGESLHKDEER